MAKSNAERQREYRAKKKQEYAYNLNTNISSMSGYQLDFLSWCYGVTKKELIEKLLEKAYREHEQNDPKHHEKTAEYVNLP